MRRLFNGKSKIIISYLLLLIFVYNISYVMYAADFPNRQLTMAILTIISSLCWFAISKILYRIYIILACITFVFIYPINTIYGSLNFDLFLSISYSNYQEAFSYFNAVPNYMWWQIVFQTLLSILLLFSRFFNRAEFNKNKILKFIPYLFFTTLSILSLRVFYVSKPLQKFDFDAEYIAYTPVARTALMTYIKTKKVKQFKLDQEIILQQVNATPYIKSQKKLEKEIYIIVIGESLSTKLMYAYGYDKWNNTPFINSSPNIQFNNYISAATHTEASLIEVFMFKNNLDQYESIFTTIKKHADAKIAYISNQWKYNPIATLAHNADTQIYVGAKVQNLDGDRKLLDYLKEIIPQKKYNVAFLHMYGSHPFSCDRTKGYYKNFIENKDISCYLESVFQTDDFMKQIVGFAKSNFKTYKILFFSDHGLRISENRMMHGQEPVCTQTPLNYWADDITKQTRINAFRSGLDFKYFWNDFFAWNDTLYQTNYKFISEEKDPKPIQYFNEEHKLVPFPINK